MKKAILFLILPFAYATENRMSVSLTEPQMQIMYQLMQLGIQEAAHSDQVSTNGYSTMAHFVDSVGKEWEKQLKVWHPKPDTTNKK